MTLWFGGIMETDLAFWFKVSQLTVSRIIIAWIIVNLRI